MRGLPPPVVVMPKAPTPTNEPQGNPPEGEGGPLVEVEVEVKEEGGELSAELGVGVTP